MRSVLEEYARDRFLDGEELFLDEDSIPWILNHIDCFVSQSRGNESIRNLYFLPYAPFGDQGDNNGVWEKVGQAVRNLRVLNKILISTYNYREDCNVSTPGWERAARILSHVRQKITLSVNIDNSARAEHVQSFARAIRGHPSITSFEEGDVFPFECMDSLYSALATLPALESVKLTNSGRQSWLERGSTRHESLTELLRLPTLRSVYFHHFYFTRALCQATANALIEGTAITKLEFSNCSFGAIGVAEILVKAFSRNTSVSDIEVEPSCDDVALFDVLAAALPLNSTLRNLFIRSKYNNLSTRVPPVLSALEKNTGLKTMSLDCSGSINESLCTAIKNGLRTNETLETLELVRIPLCTDDSGLWRRALSFLRTNKALKSLKIALALNISHGASCVSAFRLDIAAMLQENTSLESLSIQYCNIKTKAEDYIALVTALQHNTALKSLELLRELTIRLNDDENKHLASLLNKNYALESLPDTDLENKAGDAGSILRLNGAGRRYLIEDGSSISKGVEVLSRVNNDINCSFLHLLENPRLCDRSAVEMVMIGESNGRSTSPTASSGGRRQEQASARTSNDFRRRLA